MAELRRHYARVDRDRLHRYLYRKADARGRLEVKIGDLGDDLGVERSYMGRIIKEMVDAGRLRKVKARVTGVWTYEITDPDEWAQKKKLVRTRRPVWQ